MRRKVFSQITFASVQEREPLLYEFVYKKLFTFLCFLTGPIDVPPFRSRSLPKEGPNNVESGYGSDYASGHSSEDAR